MRVPESWLRAYCDPELGLEEIGDALAMHTTEVDIGEDAAGIAVLDDGVAPGTPLGEVFPVSEAVLELEVNSNRVDCLGVYGVARELHAITAAELAPVPWEEDAEARGEGKAS